MSNPFTQTMTPPFTGQLWRASALHRRVQNDILVRRLRAEEARLSLSPLPGLIEVSRAHEAGQPTLGRPGAGLGGE